MARDIYKPLFANEIDIKPDFAVAVKIANSFLFMFMTAEEDQELPDIFVTAGFSSPDSLAELDRFLYQGSLLGRDEGETAELKMKNINTVRNYLKPFLPEQEKGEDDGVKRGGKISHKDTRGRKSTGGTGFDPFD